MAEQESGKRRNVSADIPALTEEISLERVPPLIESAEAAAERLLARKDSLAPDMESEKLGELIALYEEVTFSLSLAAQFAGALFSGDTSDRDAKHMESTVSRRSTEVGTKLLFFGLTIKSWGEDVIERHAQALPQHRAWLARLAEYAPYTLSEEEERVIAYKDLAGEDRLIRIYELITSRFTYHPIIDGEEKELSQNELTLLFKHPEREVRKAAIEALRPPYEEHYDVLSEIYAGVAADFDNENVKLRGFDSPLAARHLASQIPAEAFDALKETFEQNLPLLREYVQTKVDILGYDEFTRYDFYAPVPGMPEKLSFAEAKEKVFSAFGGFADWMEQSARQVFDAGRIDAQNRKRKISGAWCYPMVPREVPIVMCTWNDHYKDLFTLAHELGHAVHNTQAWDHSVLSFRPPLTLAETASNFGEQLILQQELAAADDRTRRALLCNQLDDAIASIARQLHFTEFERRAHDMLQAGEPVQKLDKVWVEVWQEYFPDVEYGESDVTWLAIPHMFFTPFYCYSYSFGLLLVLSLWKRYEEEGDGFPPKMRRILAAGGSVPPAELLGELGFDITATDFWQGGFDIIAGYLEEIKSLS